MKTIAIIVTSDACRQYIAPMVQAAHNKGLSVHLHFTGPGVCLLASMALQLLTTQARVTICRNSAEVHQIDSRLPFGNRQMLAGPGEMVRLIETCDRHVVL